MTDVLIPNVPDHVVVAIDAAAERLGLSRAEYLRRTLARECRPRGAVHVDDLASFADRFSDLADHDVIDEAWRARTD